MRTPKLNSGLTLVELLVAIAVFGVVMTVLLGPLVQSLGMTRESSDTLSLNTRGKSVLESVRGQWRGYKLDLSQPPGSTENAAATTKNTESLRRYALTCVENLDLANASVVVEDLDVTGAVTASRTLTNIMDGSNCSGTLPTLIPPIKRITVTVDSPNSDSAVSFALDVVSP